MQISTYSREQAAAFLALLSPETKRRCDSIAFARSFEYRERELERVEHTPMLSEKLIPSGPFGTSPGHKTVTYTIVNRTGKAGPMNRGAKDAPRIDVDASEFEVEIVGLWAEYAYDVVDIDRMAVDPTIRLDAEKKRAAKEAMMLQHDEYAAIGSTKHGRTGFLNATTVPIVTPITGAHANPATSTDNIIADYMKLLDAPRIATGNLHEADTLVVDDSEWAVLNKPRGSTDTTIREYLMKNVRNLKTIEVWSRLNLANTAGNGPRAVAYKKDPSVVRYYNVLPIRELAPETDKTEIVVTCYGYSGFTNWRRPKAAAYLEGHV